MNNANSITIDLAWYNILSEFSDSLRRRVFDAILTFAATGKRPSFKGQAKLAFELIAHEISKQITISESSEDSVSSETSEFSENSDSPEETPATPSPLKPLSEKEIIDKFYQTCKVPGPVRMYGPGNPHILSEERIHSLVEVTVKDILKSGVYKPDTPGFFRRLENLVSVRYDIVCKEMMPFIGYSTINELCWMDMFDKARRDFPAAPQNKSSGMACQ